MHRATALLLLLISGSALAQDNRYSDKEVTAWNNVQYEITQCAAFWQLLRACMPEDAKPEQVQQAKKVTEHFSELAITIGKEIGMTQDAMISRLKMALEDQSKLTQGKCLNFSSLAERHLARCKALGEHPEGAFHKYMNK